MEPIKKYFFKLSIPKSVNALYNSAYNPKTGKSKFYMNADAKDAKDLLMMEIKVQGINNRCPKFKDVTVIGEIVAVNMNKNRDMNNLHKLLWDAFQKMEIIDNDKNLIERSLYEENNDEKECYLKVWIYEAKGTPSEQDINQYFYWLKSKEHSSTDSGHVEIPTLE